MTPNLPSASHNARRLSKPRGVLTDRTVAAAKPKAKPYKLADGQGLYVLVNPNGSKLWRWKYRNAGLEKLMPLGSFPSTLLSQARDSRDQARQKLARDVDPMQERKVTKAAAKVAAANSFEDVAKLWWESWRIEKSEQHAGQVWRRFEANVFQAIGRRPISEIKAPELVAMMKSIHGRGPIDLAKRALQTSSQVFRYAIAHGLADRNPAEDVRPSDVLPATPKRHLPHIHQKELPELLRRIDAYQGTPQTRLALRLIALTFVRTTELLCARWSEFDLEAARWDVPAERMKMKTPQVVPLSRQSVEVLKTLQTTASAGELLFPGERDHEKPMSNNTLLQALKRMGYAGRMTGHGFRSIASTVLHELGCEHAHIELQLAHQERNAVSAAYNFATYLPQRAALMQRWANYLDECRSGKVVHIRRIAA